MLEVKNVEKRYVKRKWPKKEYIDALHNVSLTIKEGETVGLVGESGCGKSTLGKCLAYMESITNGELYFQGKRITKLSAKEARMLRRDIQLISQEPIESLNPKLTIKQILMEPLQNFRIGNVGEREQMIEQAIIDVGLHQDHLRRYPTELSRGQCQRINIARALLLHPKIIICDEIISALDVSTGHKILKLLETLQKDYGFGYLFISHDLSKVMEISNKIAVMFKGTIVEEYSGSKFYVDAKHPYSRMLLSVIPQPVPRFWEKHNIVIPDERSETSTKNASCKFFSRCTYTANLCRSEKPALIKVNEGHYVACHHI